MNSRSRINYFLFLIAYKNIKNFKEKYIKFPRIEFQITNSKNPDEKSLCVITPNSINDEVKMLGEKFYFGKDDPRYAKKNHYNLNDDSIGVRQFEIAYNQGL